MSYRSQEGIMNEHLRHAMEALETGAADARRLSVESTAQVRARLRRTVEEVLEHLEADEEAAQPRADDIFSSLDRQSQSIAEDLRRAERLMKRRMGQE
jgi:cobalamin biosynthesis protein CbiD